MSTPEPKYNIFGELEVPDSRLLYLGIDPNTGRYIWSDQSATCFSPSTGKYIPREHGEVPVPMVDTQAIQIAASRNVQIEGQPQPLPETILPKVSNRPKLDAWNVIVNFYWNDIHKKEYISGPYTPGEANLQRPPDRPATDKDREMFAPQYEAYKTQRDQCRVGTVLSKVFSQEQAQSLYKIGIYNVEQAGEINQNVLDHHKQISPEIKAMARRYLDYVRHQKAIDDRNQAIADQAEKIRKLEAELNKSKDKPVTSRKKL